MRDYAQFDAVTLDAYGTLIELDDPVGRLCRLLPGHDRVAVERAFQAEAAYYVASSLRGDEAGLAQLHEDCVAVFNRELGSSLSAEEYLGELTYRVLPGVPEALARLRSRGLDLAVVSNFDCGLAGHLASVGLAPFFSVVLSSAEAGVEKPDPAIFRVALGRLGVEPGRAFHVGDGDVDGQGAAAAGMAFEPAPVR